MTIADSINAAANTPLTGVARRMDLLQSNGHGWIEPETQMALAETQTSDIQMLGTASAWRQAIDTHAAQQGTSVISSIGHWFGDPVLSKQPSTALALRQYLMHQQGWAPVAETDLTHIQQQLVDGGYLDKSGVNGVWTPESAQAFSAASSDHVDKQIKEGGGFSITHVLGAFMPTHWIPAFAGAVKAIPDEVRHIAADVWSGTKDIPDVLTGQVGTAKYKQDYAENQAQALNALGDNTTPQEVLRHNLTNQIDAINAILTVIPVARAGAVAARSFSAARAAAANAAINDAAGTGIFRGVLTDLGPEAAQRGPGVVSRTLYARGSDDKALGLLGSRLFQQAPILRQVTEPIKWVFDPEGKPLHAYYLARTGLAQAYRLGGVQALGATFNATTVAGAAERGIAAAEGPLGKHNALRDQIYAEGLIGGHFGLALDLASAAFHGPIATPFTRAAALEGRQVLIGINPSQSVASLVDGVSQALDAAQKPLNVGWALHVGTDMAGDAITVEDMTAKYGAPFTQQYLNDKINQFAAAHYAEKTLGDADRSSQDYLDQFRALSHDALHNPELLRENRDDLLGDLVGLATRFGRDATNIHRESRDLYRQGIDQFAEVHPAASELFTAHAKELVAPSTRAAIRSAQEDRRFAETMGDTPVGPEPGAYSGYLAENHPGHDLGSIGLARRALPGQDAEVETQTARQFLDTAKGLQDRLDKAGSAEFTAEEAATHVYDPEAIQQVRRDAIRWLFTYTGKDHRELDGLSAQQLIDVIKDASDRAPRDVSLSLDPSPEAQALWNQVRDAGYKVVAGTDIGHTFTPPLINPVLIEGYHSLWRDVAKVLAVSTIPVPVKDAGTARRLLVEREFQKGINAGRIRVPPGMNAARLHMWVLDNLESRAELSRGEAMAFAASRPLHEKAARIALGENASAEDIAEHLQMQRALIAKGSQPVEVRPKEIVKALTRPMPESMRTALDKTSDVPLMDEKSANLVADLYVRALIHEPAWMFGAGKLEDLYRAGFGFLGTKASEKVPLLRSIARAPNASIRFRNRYRFQLDPMFSMRRVAKSALKASIPGQHGVAAPFTVRPYGYMHDAGTVNEDLAVLNRVLPMKGAEGFDTNDRLLYEQDAFGIYNPRHHMALRAGELARAGLDDTAIRKDLERTFTYGDRTALERTVGTVFYPFSFERTLWRNVGSYMLDRPGSRLLAGAALQSYSALSQAEGIDDWLKDHFPLLKELQKLNAFDHGIGPGQLGGINALYAPALWNLHGPQKYGAMKEPELNAVFNLVPVLRELNSLLVGESVYSGTHHGGSLIQQAGIGLWGVQHALDKATTIIGMGHALDSPFHLIGMALPLRSETWSAEQNRAWAYRNSLILALTPVLDWNYHNRSQPKVWGATAPDYVRGTTVNRESIDEIVHHAYSSFDPAAARSFAVEKKTEMARYLTDLALNDPARADAYKPFVDTAEKLRPILQRAIYDPTKYTALAKATELFREYAVNLAEQDPQFLKLYNAFYVGEFGPIEAVTL